MQANTPSTSASGSDTPSIIPYVSPYFSVFLFGHPPHPSAYMLEFFLFFFLLSSITQGYGSGGKQNRKLEKCSEMLGHSREIDN